MSGGERRVAVLGGAGFAGRNVCDELRAAGMAAESFSRTSGCDLRDLPQAWERLSAFRPTHLVNCAAHVGSVNYVSDFAADVIDDNMRMVLNLYRIARQMREAIVVNPIANCAFPGVAERYEESDLWNGPIHPSVLSYGASRRLIDSLAECYRAQYGVRSANVFVPNMYGPYDSVSPNKTHALNALAIKFVQAVKRGDAEVEVWGTGKPVREWLYVKDFARVVRRIVESGEAFAAPVNIGQNHGLTVNELVAIVAEATGYQGQIRHNLKYPDGSPRKVMSDKLFRQRFPDFRFTPFEEGLRETIAYYKETFSALK
jgi:GDP-L-fucose synthase